MADYIVRQVPSPPTVVTLREKTAVVVEKPIAHVVELGIPGPPGPQGIPGPAGGSTVEYTAGETIFGLRAVRAAGGLIYHPDTTVVAHSDAVVGVALQSGTVGAQLLVQLSGELVEPSWAWLPGAVYCGQGGVLTQSPAATGWLLSVGRASSATSLIIDIDTAFIRV